MPTCDLDRLVKRAKIGGLMKKGRDPMVEKHLDWRNPGYSRDLARCFARPARKARRRARHSDPHKRDKAGTYWTQPLGMGVN